MARQAGATPEGPITLPAQVHQERNLILRPGLDQVLVAAILVLILAIRLLSLDFNTLFIDEALYIEVGRGLLRGESPELALTWLSGSYLYPALAAAVEQVAGVGAVRGLSALLSTASAGLVYLLSRRLFGPPAALWGTLLFGLSGVSIFVGQFAVLEALVTPLLAGAIYLTIRGAASEGRAGQLLLIGASVCFGLAALAKYLLVLYLPALLLLLLALDLRDGRPLGRRLPALAVPAALMLGGYGLANYAELWALLHGPATFAAGTPETILKAIWQEAGLVLALAAIGGALTLAGLARADRERRGLWLIVGGLLGAALLALPLYQLISGNARSADKHAIYLLLWLAPLAGHACVSLVAALKEHQARDGGSMYHVAGVAAVIAAAALCTSSLERVWVWQHSWPNVSAAVAALRATEIDPGGAVLAEGSAIYAYYLGGAGPERRWHSTWSFSYGGQSGLAAMEAAIDDGYFAAVVLDSYYTPGVRDRLEPALASAGYQAAYASAQPLSSGDTILTTIHLRPATPEP